MEPQSEIIGVIFILMDQSMVVGASVSGERERARERMRREIQLINLGESGSGIRA